MAKSETSPRERAIMGLLLVATVLLGSSLVASSEMTVVSTRFPKDMPLAFLALALAALTFAWCLTCAVRFFGGRDGLRLLGREGWPALWIGAVLGFLLGFALRALTRGYAGWFGLAVLYVGGLAVVVWMAQRADAQRWDGTGFAGFLEAAGEYLVPLGT